MQVTVPEAVPVLAGGWPRRLRVTRRHPAISSARPVRGARGSANVAVPTCTATAPASSSSAASHPEATPPTPTIGSVGERRVDVVHGAHGDRVDRRAGQPAATGAERRLARARVVGQAEQRVDARHRLGAGARPRRRRPRRCGRCWRSAWPSAAARSRRWRRSTSADSSGSWAKMASAAPSRLGHDRLTSTATTPAGAAPAGRRRRRSRRPSGPRCDATTVAPVASRSGRTWSSQCGTPGPCRPTALSIPFGVGCSRGAGLPAHSKAASDLTTTAPSADRSR